MRLVNVLPAYRPSGALGAWVRQVATNVAIDAYRRRRRAPLLLSDEEMPEAPVPAAWQPDAIAERREEAARIRALLDRMPPELSEPLILRDLMDRDYPEIAEQLAIPLGTVKSRIHRARQTLARARRALGRGGSAGHRQGTRPLTDAHSKDRLGDLVSALAAGELDPAEAQRVRARLAEDPELARLYGEIRAARRGLADLPPPAREAPPPGLQGPHPRRDAAQVPLPLRAPDALLADVARGGRRGRHAAVLPASAGPGRARVASPSVGWGQHSAGSRESSHRSGAGRIRRAPRLGFLRAGRPDGPAGGPASGPGTGNPSP